MKKKILFIAAIMGASFGSIAQDDGDAKVYTPEAGDWALGFDAAPILNYVGNMFNGTAGNSLGSDFVGSDNIIFGKYYTNATTAYRGQIRIMNFSGTSNVLTDTVTPGYNNGGPGYITDTYKTTGSAIVIGGGIEKRKGEGRFQGYYGGELLITIGTNGANTTNTFEATLDSANIANGYAINGRTLSSKAGSVFSLGLRGFIGVEYFIAPKISLGAEFGWGLALTTFGEGEAITENFGYVITNGTAATTETIYEVTTMTAKSSSFGIDTDNMGGRIKLLFHF